MPPPEKQLGGAELPHVLMLNNTFTMYLTIPVTSATSERTFSALRRLKNYLRSTMKQDHQQLPTDEFSKIDYRRTRHQRTTNAKGILENLCRGICMAEWKMSPPSFKTLRRLCDG